ncbi:MAG: APC family permease [Mycoplasma sp.]|nr:APC family permease [Mycoplasma sp.]
MKKSRAKKFGLWTSISLMVGSVVGIGIFFKNNSIFANANGNGIVILSSWVISGLISLGAALSFAEIGSGVHGKTGLSNYMHEIIGKKVGKLSKIVEPTFYHSVLIFALSCFAAESVLKIFLPNQMSSFHIGFIVLIGISIWIFFWILTILSSQLIGKIQVISTFIKFVPLITIMIIGLLGINNSHSNSVFNNSHYIDSNNHKQLIGAFKPGLILTILPSILFTFDGFIHVTNISTDIKNPKKNVPLGIIFGMIGVVVIYILITLGQLLTGTTTAEKLLSIAFSKLTSTSLTNILNVFIAVAALGVCNGFIMSQVRSTEGALEEGLLIGSKKIMKKLPKMYGFVYTLLIFLATASVISIPTIIKNSDAIIDSTSNFAALYFFILYIVLIIGQIINRLKIEKIYTKNKRIKIKRFKEQRVMTKNINGFIFYPLAIISILGIFLCVFHEIFYTSLYETFTLPFKDTGFGLFHNDKKLGRSLKNWEHSLLFFISLIIFVTLPQIIYKIQRKYNW